MPGTPIGGKGACTGGGGRDRRVEVRPGAMSCARLKIFIKFRELG